MPKVTNKERQRCWRHRTFLRGNKMSEADKLFYNLGYDKVVDNEDTCRYQRGETKYILFDKYRKRVFNWIARRGSFVALRTVCINARTKSNKYEVQRVRME